MRLLNRKGIPIEIFSPGNFLDYNFMGIVMRGLRG